MADTSARTLRLLSLLQARRYWTGSALADRLEVSERTVRRDVDRLRQLGYPVEARPGLDGGYQLASGAALPPLVLDDDEGAAIAVGLLAAVHSPVSGTAEASARALAKLVQVMPDRLRRRVDALRTTTQAVPWVSSEVVVDAGILGTVAQAARDGERLEIDYRAADGQIAERRVEPHRLVALGQRWYLVAYDNWRSDWRTFRIDRLVSARVTGVRFAERHIPTGDAATFVRAGIAQAPRPYRVEAVVEAAADHVRAKVGRWCEVEVRSSASCTVRINTESLEWAATALLMSGAGFSVVDPPDLVSLLSAWRTRIVGATGGGVNP